jgi:hypothetical protein
VQIQWDVFTNRLFTNLANQRTVWMAEVEVTDIAKAAADNTRVVNSADARIFTSEYDQIWSDIQNKVSG